MSEPAVITADTAEVRKARGAFFTPDAITRYITDWAIRTSRDTVLEPSAGDAAFLVQAVRRLRALELTLGDHRQRMRAGLGEVALGMHALGLLAADQPVFQCQAQHFLEGEAVLGFGDVGHAGLVLDGGGFAHDAATGEVCCQL